MKNIKNLEAYRIFVAHGFKDEEAERLIRDLTDQDELATKKDLQIETQKLETFIYKNTLVTIGTVITFLSALQMFLAYKR